MKKIMTVGLLKTLGKKLQVCIFIAIEVDIFTAKAKGSSI